MSSTIITMNRLLSKIFKRYRIIIKRKLFLLTYKTKRIIYLDKITRDLIILIYIFRMTNLMKPFKFKRKLFWKSKLKHKILKNSNKNTINYMMHCLNGWKLSLVFRICSGLFMMSKRKNTMRLTYKFFKTFPNNMNNMKAIQEMKTLE